MAKPQYGADHQRRRQELVARDTGKPCPSCGTPMLRGLPTDAAHSTDVAVDPQAKADHLQCARCNRSAGGRLGNARRRFRPSRSW